ncbi:MAG: hypothetical protein JXR83_23500 [Deltaproteobacteria bacterium]|nr:hypothetical protein [Deltaproteobacteria bacterium]
MSPANDRAPIHPKETWASLAMKHYGDALLGVRLAEANGVTSATPPASLAGITYPPVEALDPERQSRPALRGPTQPHGGIKGNAFADDEASVVKEARYRLVMAMGGSGAVNAAPSAVSSRPVERKELRREEKIAEAKKSRKDMAEAIGEKDGKELILDVKPTKHRQDSDQPKKVSTKNNLAGDMARREGKELILEVKPGVVPDDDDEITHMGDALAAKDGKALILEVKAATRREPKKNPDGTPVEEASEPQPAMGERFGDEVAKLDGRALLLDVRASVKKKETAEQIAAKKKKGATEELFKELGDKDGKELILDLNVQVEDKQKFEALKERRKLAKKRRRRSGAGSLIPEQWQAAGDISADAVEDYLDELKEARLEELERFGEDSSSDTSPIARAAKQTHHRSAQVARPTYSDAGHDGTVRPATDGVGAYEQIQHEEVAVQAGVLQRPRRDRQERAEAQIDALKTDPGTGRPAPPPTPPTAAPAPRRADPAPPLPAAARASPPPRSPSTGGQPRRDQQPLRAAPPSRPMPQPLPRPSIHPDQGQMRRPVKPIPAPARPSAADWDDDDGGGSVHGVSDPSQPRVSDWDDEDNAMHLSGLSGLSGVSRTGIPSGPLPSVSAQDPFAPEAMARLCMLSPGTVMQVARSAPVGAGAVLELIGKLREAKSENEQTDLLRKFIAEHRERATQTLELLLTR